jgi:hypothetical protein
LSNENKGIENNLIYSCCRKNAKTQGRIIHPILPPQQITYPAIKMFNVSIISGHIPGMFLFLGFLFTIDMS